MPDRDLPCYRFRGNVQPSAEVARPVAAYRNAVASGGNGAAVGSSSATIDIFDVIDSYGGWWGISAGEVDAALKQVGDVDTLFVRLNSPGGEATEGVAIANLLRAHPAKVRVTVYGLAASAASYIAIAGDTVSMGPGSLMFIHDALNIAIGDAADLRKVADTLDTISDSIAGLYVLKAGGTTEEWRSAMHADTWYSAEAAVAAKLADAVGIDPELPTDLPPIEEADTSDDGATVIELDIEISPAARAAARRFDLSLLPNAPAALVHPQTPAEAPANPQGGEAVAFTDEQITTMRQRLGLPEDATEDTILGALDEALEERADETAAAASATQLPEGLVAIEASVLEELRTQASAGAQARAQQERERREGLVKAAVADGRIAPARRDHWLAQLEADPGPEGAEKVLASLAKGLIPVAELGHGGPANDKPFTDDEADQLGALAGLPKGALR